MRSVTKRLVLAWASAGFLAAAPARSGADMISYTETVTATGSLGGSTFQDSLLTLTFVGDTADVTNPSAGIYRNPVGTATATVDGITATLDGPVDVFVNQTDGVAGIETFAPLLTVQDPALTGYALTGPIGVLTGPSAGGLNLSFPTSAGTLEITSIANTATFQAAVPEPASLLLLGLGIAGMAASRLRRAAPVPEERN